MSIKKKLYRAAMVLLIIFIAILWCREYLGRNTPKAEKQSEKAEHNLGGDRYYDEAQKMEREEFEKYQIKGIGEKVTYYDYPKGADLTVLKCDIYYDIPEQYLDCIKEQRKHGVDCYLFENNLSYDEFAASNSVIIDLTLDTTMTYPGMFFRSGSFGLYELFTGKLLGDPTAIYNDNMTFLDMGLTNRVSMENNCGVFTFEDDDRDKSFHLVYACSKKQYEAGGLVISNNKVDTYLDGKYKCDNKQYIIKLME